MRELNIAPELIISDFELAIINAAAVSFPEVEQHGCYFPFRQCLWKKLQRLGLINEFDNINNLKKCLKRFFKLGNVQLKEVVTYYTFAKNEIEQFKNENIETF